MAYARGITIFSWVSGNFVRLQGWQKKGQSKREGTIVLITLDPTMSKL